MDRRTNRWPVAIFLGATVGLVQLFLFAAIAYFAWRDLNSGIPVPMSFCSRVFNNQLVFPVGEVVLTSRQLGVQGMSRFRAVDLTTGNTRDFPVPRVSMSYPMNSLCDEQSLWYFFSDKVLRFDGAQVESIETMNMPSPEDQVSDPFLYDGKPTLIIRDDAGQYRLCHLENALEEGRWVTGQRVALPGPNRIWRADERTGVASLVPIVAPDSLGAGFTFYRVSILQVDGELHLLQTEIPGPPGSSRKMVTCYRKGLELIPAAEDQAALSALDPENLLPEVTGWMLLDSKIQIDQMSGSPFVIEGGIGFTSGGEIWHQVQAQAGDAPVRFEVLRKVDGDKIGEIGIAQDTQSKATYVISNILKEKVDLYRLQGSELLPVPIQIDGVMFDALRWMVKLTLIGLGIIALGFVSLVLITNVYCDRSAYSFGHDTVHLASIFRRSVARTLDLSFMFAPLICFAIWMFADQFHWSLYQLLSNDHLAVFQPLVPFAVWVIIYWCCAIITTALWGVTAGKWVCQIRVVRSTLRRCGFARALLRELLLWIDMPQFLTAIPGVVCIMGTPHRQRIGDLIAGTVVVVHRPLINCGLNPSDIVQDGV